MKAEKSFIIMVITIILAITWFVYRQSNTYQLTNWDDPGYTYNNQLFTNYDKDEFFNRAHLKAIFNPDNTVLMHYHPFTIISLGIDYQNAYLHEQKNSEDIHISGKPFHRTNLLLHLLNTLLVFIFIYRMRPQIFIASLVALLFGIHPMHVEAVAWISARKELLYTCFTLLTLLMYQQYLKQLKTKGFFMKAGLFFLVFLLFFAGLLSKISAIVIPLLMLLIDYYQGRLQFAKWPILGKWLHPSQTIKEKPQWTWLIEKIPFFALAVIFGLINMENQSGAISNAAPSLINRALVAGYGWTMYLIKIIVPFQMSAFHPYPKFIIDESMAIPWHFYLPFLAFVIVNTLVIWSFIKGLRKQKPSIFAFGFLFYLFSVMFVLQFLSVGMAVMAERYTYLSYVGIFFVIGHLLHQYIPASKTKWATVALIILLSPIGLLTYQQLQVWENSGTMWSQVIRHYPDNAPVAYKNRGKHYMLREQNATKALKDYQTLLPMMKAWIARGVDLDEVARIYTNYGNIYSVKATQIRQNIAKQNINEHELQQANKEMLNYINTANKAYDQSIKYDSSFLDAYINKSNNLMFLKRYKDLIQLFEQARRFHPNNKRVLQNLHFYKGFELYREKAYLPAIENFKKTLEINPDYINALFNISVCYYHHGNLSKAKEYALLAQRKGYKLPGNYKKLLNISG